MKTITEHLLMIVLVGTIFGLTAYNVSPIDMKNIGFVLYFIGFLCGITMGIIIFN